MRRSLQLTGITLLVLALATGPAEAASRRETFGVRTTGGDLAHEGQPRTDTARRDPLRLGSAAATGPLRKRKVAAYTEHAGETPAPNARIARDVHGNAAGAEWDLAHDGAFRGKKITVLQLYNGEDEPAGTEPFDFVAPTRALEQKGFRVKRLTSLPSPDELARDLGNSSQLWVVSSGRPSQLTDGHHQVIEEFFDRGHGLYLWGDNEPYVHEASEIAERMFGAHLEGNYGADQHLHPEGIDLPNPGIKRHLVTTGLERLYEGVTTSAVGQRRFSYAMKDLLVGSNGAIVAGVHESPFADRGGRAILDGGFTRLFLKWDTAGTARYVTNAAAWLHNAERFDP